MITSKNLWNRPVYLNSLGLVYSIHLLSINLSFLLHQSLVSLRPYSKTIFRVFHTLSLYGWLMTSIILKLFKTMLVMRQTYQSVVAVLSRLFEHLLMLYDLISPPKTANYQNNFLVSISVSIIYSYTKCQKILNNNTLSFYCGN